MTLKPRPKRRGETGPAGARGRDGRTPACRGTARTAPPARPGRPVPLRKAQARAAEAQRGACSDPRFRLPPPRPPFPGHDLRCHRSELCHGTQRPHEARPTVRQHFTRAGGRAKAGRGAGGRAVTSPGEALEKPDPARPAAGTETGRPPRGQWQVSRQWKAVAPWPSDPAPVSACRRRVSVRPHGAHPHTHGRSRRRALVTARTRSRAAPPAGQWIRDRGTGSYTPGHKNATARVSRGDAMPGKKRRSPRITCWTTPSA